MTPIRFHWFSNIHNSVGGGLLPRTFCRAAHRIAGANRARRANPCAGTSPMDEALMSVHTAANVAYCQYDGGQLRTDRFAQAEQVVRLGGRTPGCARLRRRHPTGRM